MTRPTTALSIRADRWAAAIVLGGRAWPVLLLLAGASVLAPSPVALGLVALAAAVGFRQRRVLRALLGALLHDDPLFAITEGQLRVGGERIDLIAVAGAEPVTERIAERDVATGVRIRLRDGGRRRVDLRATAGEPEADVGRVLRALGRPVV